MAHERASPSHGLIESLAEQALAMAAPLPEAVQRKAGLCLLDFLAACLAGAALPWSQQALGSARVLGAGGACTLLVDGGGVSPGEAAFANAVLGGSTSQMDTLADCAAHPGVVVLPSVLAGAELLRSNGADMLAAICAGYQVMARLGRAMYFGATEFRARPTGVIGPVAAAAALARLARLDRERTMQAIALAANTGAGLMEWAHSGTMELCFHAATAARNGMTSWQLASHGAKAAPGAIEGAAGLIATFTSANVVRSAPAEEHEILLAAHKPVPACIFVQTPCQLALELATTGTGGSLSPPLRVEQVEEVRVRVHPMARAYPGCDLPSMPSDPQAARMSIQYSVAATLARRSLSAANWQRPGTDPATAQWLEKCRLAVFDEDDAGKRSCQLEIVLKDGTFLQAAAEDVRPDSPEAVRNRFTQAAQSRLAPGMASRIIEWTDDLRRLPQVEPLLQAMRAVEKG